MEIPAPPQNIVPEEAQPSEPGADQTIEFDLTSESEPLNQYGENT
jgi:hypothetical protein